MSELKPLIEAILYDLGEIPNRDEQFLIPQIVEKILAEKHPRGPLRMEYEKQAASILCEYEKHPLSTIKHLHTFIYSANLSAHMIMFLIDDNSRFMRIPVDAVIPQWVVVLTIIQQYEGIKGEMFKLLEEGGPAITKISSLRPWDTIRLLIRLGEPYKFHAFELLRSLQAQLTAAQARIEELEKSDLQTLMNYRAEWVDSVPAFKKQTILGVLNHLKKEVKELIANPTDPHEFADCFGLLLGHWTKIGGNAESALQVCYEKLEICKTRTYGKPDADGSIQHIKQP